MSGLLHRDDAIARIKEALRQKSPRLWSVTAKQGWITVHAPPRRRTAPYGYLTTEDRAELARLFRSDGVTHQGLLIGPADRLRYAIAVEGTPVSEEGDMDSRCFAIYQAKNGERLGRPLNVKMRRADAEQEAQDLAELGERNGARCDYVVVPGKFVE